MRELYEANRAELSLEQITCICTSDARVHWRSMTSVTRATCLHSNHAADGCAINEAINTMKGLVGRQPGFKLSMAADRQFHYGCL